MKCIELNAFSSECKLLNSCSIQTFYMNTCTYRSCTVSTQSKQLCLGYAAPHIIKRKQIIYHLHACTSHMLHSMFHILTLSMHACNSAFAGEHIVQEYTNVSVL